MNDFEERQLYTHHLQPLAWYRYSDDIFCLWQHGGDELEKFTAHLNSVHETIKFTIEKSRTFVSFLDNEVHLDNNRIYMTSTSNLQTATTTYPLTLHIRTIARTALWSVPMHSSYAYGEYAVEKKTTAITAWKRQPY